MENAKFRRTPKTPPFDAKPNAGRGAFDLVLASRSPRRQSLLTAAGYSFTAIPADDAAEESPRFCPDPASLVIRNARKKAASAAGKFSVDSDLGAGLRENLSERGRVVIIGCDTVAYIEHNGEAEILGKPDDRADARRMLRLLSGSDHAVVSGLALILLPSGREYAASETTTLYMDALSDEWIEHYLDSGAWRGKAGAFGYQDGIDRLHKKSGSESNIVGLPMELLQRLLDSMDL